MNARILRPVFGLGFRISKTAELALAMVVLALLAIFLPHTTDALVALGVGVLPMFGMYVDAQLVVVGRAGADGDGVFDQHRGHWQRRERHRRR
jgi:hypothetical protein